MSISYRSLDDDPEKSRDFLKPDFNEPSFRESYGLDSYQRVKEDQSHDVRSDHDHYVKDFKRKNLIELFLQGIECDRYITTHLYGEVQGAEVNESITLPDLLDRSAQLKSFMDASYMITKK